MTDYPIDAEGAYNKLQLQVPMDYLCGISQNSVEYFQRRRFSKVCIKFAMFKLSLADNVGGVDSADNVGGATT